MRINRVYNYYREWGLEVNGKYVGRTFINCPKRIVDEAVVSGDERLKPIEWDEFVLREAKWDKELKQRVFYKFSDKMDRDFFSTYKKVYDVEVVVKEDVEIPQWNGEAEIPTTIEWGSTIVLKAVPSGRLKKILETFELDSKIEKVDGKDKAWNPAKVLPFDWEDEVKNGLEWKFFSMRVRGTWLDTSYSFKEIVPFLIEQNTSSDSADPLRATKTKVSKYVPIPDEIDISDIPF